MQQRLLTGVKYTNKGEMMFGENYSYKEEETGGDVSSGGGADPVGETPAAAAPGSLSSENWRDFVSEDLRSNESLAKFTSLDGLAKSYINAEGMVGKDKIVMPTTDDEWGQAYDKLGRPETAAAYELNYPEGVDGTDEISTAFKDAAHKAGLSQNQIAQIHDWYNGTSSELAASQKLQNEQKHVEAESNLKGEWGEKYSSNVEVAKRVVAEFGDEEFSQFINESGLGNNTGMIKFLHKIGSVVSEDNVEDGSGAQQQTPDQIREEINGIMSSPAYTNKADPNHDIVVNKVASMFSRLHAAQITLWPIPMQKRASGRRQLITFFL